MMWQLQTPLFEIILRSGIIFLFLFFSFRLTGKKHLSELSPFDFILLLIMSECLQNGLVGEDYSIWAALISVSTLILLNILINRIAFSSDRAEKFLEGNPKVLIFKGKVNQKTKDHEKISDQELAESLRQEGVLDPADVYLATLETSGKISVIKKSDTKLRSRIKTMVKRLKARRKIFR